jgi:hypothetical protein
MSTSLKEMGETVKMLIKKAITTVISVFLMNPNFWLMNFGRTVCKVFQ